MGNLFVVATPIGNLNDFTKRAIETLENVDLILCEDTRVSMKFLNHFGIKKKLVSYHKFNESEKVDGIIKDLKDGKNIALISDAGTPCISDPGSILVKKVKEEKIPVLAVGGISALITALSISGLDTTNFTFYGFFPRDEKTKKDILKEINQSNVKTYVFYESPKRILKTLEYLNQNIENSKISVSRELTKFHEKNYYGTINEVIEKIKEDDKSNLGEYTFVIERAKENKKDKEPISIEALLIDEMIKKSLTLKDAINSLNEKEDSLSKKDIYNASLNLKNIKF